MNFSHKKDSKDFENESHIVRKKKSEQMKEGRKSRNPEDYGIDEEDELLEEYLRYVK